ncbi:hypothetical protein CDL15_Pgr019603 [Punica granatum]|uniref:Uncharacterized protein n=1 Tax=Punica granatum TaxID=22663 RepID=A0A218X5X5_PUNGR|nr:hypothetical protein CDL15_Pgr019603 [Punica granatum]PKI38555.1 hypothetical protein CRG98_040988 [Punica granatum]
MALGTPSVIPCWPLSQISITYWVNEAEEAAIGVDGATKIGTAQGEADHMTALLVTLNPIPRAAIATFLSLAPRLEHPIVIGGREAIRRVLLEALLELQQGRTLTFLAQRGVCYRWNIDGHKYRNTMFMCE